MMAAIIRAAPAKLNLTLEIIGARADGYHLLDSLVAFTEYGDTISVSPADTLGLTIDGPFATVLAGDISDNLVLRAARRLAEAAGVAAKAAIRLTKRLPVASGIGGGSSDAAATLLALGELWGARLPADDLGRLALGLGADVPVCLKQRPARLQGIGERITEIPALPAAPIVLVNPGIGLATPPVFKARSGPFSPGPGPAGRLSESPAGVAALALALAKGSNDLTAAAIGLLPVVGTVLAAIGKAEGCLLARMSGSGATCFGLFPSDEAAARAAAELQRAHPDWWVVATRLAPG